ncbi:hypothetical protein JKG68_28905 [Microvirga aerilata]|uniref:DUF2188 domain-containing protein n=1 Tax=Microvirga aerilata TaxID=670292 RepID=A0A936ZIP4_9HYPH|nr:hypothetical protein [Microvirga aerilata]MBL0407922.1 hypothetical protein [Microvirga aerilata]
MERFVVTWTREGRWSVSYDGETFATYPTEEEALSETFTRAAERKQAGFKVVVVLMQVRNALDRHHPLIDALGAISLA